MQYRHLHLTTPYMTGPDVERLQKKLKVYEVDGEYGPITAHAVHHKKWLMGFETKHIDEGAGVHFQRLLYGNISRDAGMRKRSERRHKVEASRQTNGKKAVEFLLAHEGGAETWGFNRGPIIDKWELANGHGAYSRGEPGWPYCGIGVWSAYKFGAGVTLPPEIRAVQNIWNYARAGTHGLRVVSLEKAPVGAILVLFGTDVHTGLLREKFSPGHPVHTIECNTSPGTTGSQADGDGIWRRDRNPGDVKLAVAVGK